MTEREMHSTGIRGESCPVQDCFSFLLCSAHFICSGSCGFRGTHYFPCMLLPVLTESWVVWLVHLGAAGLKWTSALFVLQQRFLVVHCILPNCFHLAFPWTGRKYNFQGQILENEDWLFMEETAKGEDQKDLIRKCKLICNSHNLQRELNCTFMGK